MVGRSRFGGIYSPLSQRDLATIRNLESYLDTQLGIEILGDDPDVALEVLPLNEIIDFFEEYISILQEERGTGPHVAEAANWDKEEMSKEFKSRTDYQRSLSPEGRIKWAERQRLSRYWEGRLAPILGKLKRYQRKLQNEELR